MEPRTETAVAGVAREAHIITGETNGEVSVGLTRAHLYSGSVR